MVVKVKYTGPFKSMKIFEVPARQTVAEIMNVVEKEAKASFSRQRSNKNKRYTGKLFASFAQIPVNRDGATIFKGTVFAGGPSAPYAPIVDHIGWKFQSGVKSKQPYFFMRDGRDKGEEVASDIAIKNFAKVL